MALFLLLVACGLTQSDNDPPNCSPRSAFYPDEDGDGLGESSAVFIGCEAPEGWVATQNDETGGTGNPAQ